MDDGTYAYTLIYTADRSTARNADGDPIRSIEQHRCCLMKEPAYGQKLRVQYMLEDPSFYSDIIDKIQFVEEAN
jgi:hypothetical protein